MNHSAVSTLEKSCSTECTVLTCELSSDCVDWSRRDSKRGYRFEWEQIKVHQHWLQSGVQHLLEAYSTYLFWVSQSRIRGG